MQVILFIIAVIVFIVGTILIKSSKSSKKKSNELSDRFDDTLNWEVGDTISYEDEWGFESTVILAIFKKDGIYGFKSETFYKDWKRGKERGINDRHIDKMIFIPTELINKNLDIGQRNHYLDIKSELEDEFSYHNQFLVIQDELKELNNQYNSNNNNRTRV